MVSCHDFQWKVVMPTRQRIPSSQMNARCISDTYRNHTATSDCLRQKSVILIIVLDRDEAYMFDSWGFFPTWASMGHRNYFDDSHHWCVDLMVLSLFQSFRLSHLDDWHIGWHQHMKAFCTSARLTANGNASWWRWNSKNFCFFFKLSGELQMGKRNWESSSHLY